MVVKLQNSSPKFLKSVTHYKNSTWYLKRRASNNKRVAKMVVYNSGAKKGNYEFYAFRGNGERIIINYDAQKGERSFFFFIYKHSKEVLQYVLHNGIPGRFEWLKDLYNSAGVMIARVFRRNNPNL